MMHISDLRHLVLLVLVGVVDLRSVRSAPVGDTCTYQLNLTRPCGPEGTGPIIISTDKLPLPDMVAISHTARTAVTSLLEQVIRRLDVSNTVLEDLQEEAWPLVTKVRHQLGPIETSCKQENQEDTIAALWQNLLQFIPVINYMKKYELYYIGQDTSVVLRSTTFECDLNNLEENSLANLLCGFQVVAEDQGISLSHNIFENSALVYNYNIDKEVSYHTIDKHLYIILHNLEQDFLLYANEFFQCLQSN